MRHWLLLALALLFTGLVEAAPAPKGPSLEEIRKAIDDLGSSRFAVREKASRFLWEAGATAEPLLREAALSKDEETSTRAKSILDKFDWGLYPNTPPEIVKIIEKFRGGNPQERQVAIGELLHRKPPQFSVLRKLIAREPDEQARREMYEGLAAQARQALPSLIVNGLLDDAADLLDICLVTNEPSAYRDFAQFQLLRDKVPASIATFEARFKQSKGAEAAQHATTLVYLYRAQKNWAKAKEYAEAAKNGELYDRVAWEGSDWAALLSNKASQLPNPPERGDVGVNAAYARLAGNKAKYDELIGEQRKELAGVEGDDSAAFSLAHTLLLNYQAAEAIRILQERPKRAGAQVFDLLCAQHKFREAFDLAAKVEKEIGNDEELRLNLQLLRLRKARMLGSLGDKDGATQIYRKELEAVKEAGLREGGLFSLAVVVPDMLRANLRDLAIELVAENMTTGRRAGNDTRILQMLFDEQGIVVPVWWEAYFEDKPDEKGTIVMKRVQRLLDGKMERKEVDRLAQLIEKRINTSAPPNAEVPALTQSNDKQLSFFAIAEAYRLSKVKDQADTYYKKAADLTAGTRPKGPIPDPLDDVDELLGYRPFYTMHYADYLLAEKKYAEAAQYYHKAWLSNETNPLPLFLEGHAKRLAGDAKEAQRLQDLAHWLPLGNDELRCEFSDDLVKRGFVAESQREMQFVLERGWFDSYEVGVLYARASRLQSRKQNFALAADLAEKNVAGLFRTGAAFIDQRAMLTIPEFARTLRIRALLAAKKDKEAFAEIEEALKAMPNHVDLAIGVVPDLERLGKKKEADELYTKVKKAHEAAIKEYPKAAELRNGIAWTLVNCRRDLDEARTHAEKAVELAPKTASYIDTLAEVHFRLKNRDRAIELMKQCAAIEPKNPYFRKQLQRFATADFNSPIADEETGED